MEVYSRDITCPKCGALAPQTRYVAKDCPCGIVESHLHLRCISCEYGAGWNDWAVQTMDSSAGTAAAKKAGPV